jgi:hypothetical protein
MCFNQDLKHSDCMFASVAFANHCKPFALPIDAGAPTVELHGHGWHGSEAHAEIQAKVEDLCALMEACNTLVVRGRRAKARQLPPSKVARKEGRQAMAVLKGVAASRLGLTSQQSVRQYFCNGGKIVPQGWCCRCWCSCCCRCCWCQVMCSLRSSCCHITTRLPLPAQ